MNVESCKMFGLVQNVGFVSLPFGHLLQLGILEEEEQQEKYNELIIEMSHEQLSILN